MWSCMVNSYHITEFVPGPCILCCFLDCSVMVWVNVLSLESNSLSSWSIPGYWLYVFVYFQIRWLVFSCPETHLNPVSPTYNQYVRHSQFFFFQTGTYLTILVPFFFFFYLFFCQWQFSTRNCILTAGLYLKTEEKCNSIVVMTISLTASAFYCI